LDTTNQDKADQINEKSSQNSEEKFKSSIDHQLYHKDILEIRDEKYFQENNTVNATPADDATGDIEGSVLRAKFKIFD